MMTLTLTVDHRAVDGAPAAEFLRTVKTFLEEPALRSVGKPNRRGPSRSRTWPSTSFIQTDKGGQR